MRRLTAAAHAVTRAALLGASAVLASAQAAALEFDPALAKAPPAPRSATLEVLSKPTSAGNAVLRVQFDTLRHQRQLVIQGANGPTLLRDDGVAPDGKAGDGQFAAIVQVNLEAYAAEQRRRIDLARTVKQVPVFDLREWRGLVPFRPSTIDRLKPGVVNLLDDFRGVPTPVDPERELLIRSATVVDDPTRTYNACNGTGTPMGAWTFGRLMTEITNQPVTGIDPSDFVEHWISQWKVDLSINGFTVAHRAIGAQALLDEWPKLPNSKKLDLAKAPFRLLAIVNRQDLRGNIAYGGSADAGEARLVFGLLNCRGAQSSHFTGSEAQQMTVIFEYGIARSGGCPAVRNWAAQWTALGSMVLGSAPYNAALQAITDQFTLRDANPSKLPNRSAINQVRTNEFALSTLIAGTFWELRESKLVVKGPNSGLLEHNTTAQTPDGSIRGSTRLRDFVNDNTPDILAGAHIVPLAYPLIGGTHFLGGNSESGTGASWRANGIIDLEARHRFSLATCSGCHEGERATSFLHIAPRAAGTQSALSDFLTGANMPKVDPENGVNRTFHELLDRQMKLDATAHLTCFKVSDFPIAELGFRPLPLSFPH